MPKGPFLTKADIEAYLKKREERLELNRQATALGKEEEVLAAKIEEFVAANGGKDRRCARSGFLLAILQRRGNPKWKEEFIRVAGAEEAAKVVAPMNDYLSVQPAA